MNMAGIKKLDFFFSFSNFVELEHVESLWLVFMVMLVPEKSL